LVEAVEGLKDRPGWVVLLEAVVLEAALLVVREL
jgi:hypothetical protein